MGAGHRPGLRAGAAGREGGKSDARNENSVREIIPDLFAVWDSLAERNALPDELYVVELGVSNGGQAKTWLDEFIELDRKHGKDYYRRLHYLMRDSPHVLELAQVAVADHAQHVSSFVLDATELWTALGFLRSKVGVLAPYLGGVVFEGAVSAVDWSGSLPDRARSER